MKKLVLVSLFFFFVLPAFAQELNVMTFNIRLNTAGDSLNAWPYRKDRAASQVIFHEIQILGVQEAFHEQMLDLQQRLPHFQYVGVGREDGKQKGEYSAIFYDTTRLQVLQTRTFWLSETPDVAGSKGWDASYPRVVTWARFSDKKTSKTFFVFNTHFDHIGQVARRESARIVLKTVKQVAGNSPAIFMGDFNARPTDEPITIIKNQTDPDHLVDSKEISQSPHYGPSGTFNGFQSKEIHDDPIDYIFLKGKWNVFKHATISQTWGGRFASDHFAVMARVSL